MNRPFRMTPGVAMLFEACMPVAKRLLEYACSGLLSHSKYGRSVLYAILKAVSLGSPEFVYFLSRITSPRYAAAFKPSSDLLCEVCERSE